MQMVSISIAERFLTIGKILVLPFNVSDNVLMIFWSLLKLFLISSTMNRI